MWSTADTNAIRERLAPFTDFPILFISALTKQRILKVLETAKEVYDNRKKRIPTAKLNEIMLPIIENYPPPAWKGKYIKIKYITQLPAGSVPSFVFFANLPQWIKDPYKRFLENKIRRTGILQGHRLMYLFARNKNFDNSYYKPDDAFIKSASSGSFVKFYHVLFVLPLKKWNLL